MGETAIMLIHEHPIEFYISRLKQGKYYCFPGYSDAEFYSMMGIRLGNTTGLGQVIDKEHGKLLLGVMQRRQRNREWKFAIPKCLNQLPEFVGNPISHFLARNGISIEACERDMVTDDLAREGKLFEFIEQLKKMDTVLIGPEELGNGCMNFLDYKYHLPIPSPNLHMQKDGIDWVIDKIIGRGKRRASVYLISAGVSSPVIIDRLYAFDQYHFYLDVGSIWDGFAGIGGQRQWRAELYKNPALLEEWKRRNIYGTA